MKYFGTDGIRGVYGVNIDSRLAYRVGLALASSFGEGDYVIGRDTRTSGEALTSALCSGLIDGGANVVLAGIIPTPAVSYFTKALNAVCGVVISASHNPPEYNGIKIFGFGGIKPDEQVECDIERFIDCGRPSVKRGFYRCLQGAEEQYIKHLKGCVNGDLTGLRVCIDCAYGASYSVAESAFSGLGADVCVYNALPCGERINQGVGALHPSFIAKKCRQSSCDLGFAFDGDADRVSVVYGGEELDGDSVLYNLALAVGARGAVVGTVLSNSALEQGLQGLGIEFKRAPVGDKYVSEMMREHSSNLGGEQSGHYVLSDFAATGDGILTALVLSRYLWDGVRLKSPHKLDLVAQETHSFDISHADISQPGLQDLINASQRLLYGKGRLIVRRSGTEPKLRVMVESRERDLIDIVMKDFSALLDITPSK